MKITLEKEDIERLAQEITLRVTERLKSSLVSPMSGEETVFDVAGLAKYLKVSPKWVYSHLHALPHMKIDGLLRFHKRTVDRFFEANPSRFPKPR